MSVKKMADRLEKLEEKAGNEGWGGEFREELFDEMIAYFLRNTGKNRRASAGGLLCNLLNITSKWFTEKEKADTPLEKAMKDAGRINYCDECQHFVVVGKAAFCEVSGKYLHPLMMMRGQGTGPAYHCKKAKRKEET